MNNGQTCYLGTRVLAPAARYDEVVDMLSGVHVGSLTVGDALDAGHADRPDGVGTRTATASRATSPRDWATARKPGQRRRPSQAASTPGWFVEPTVFAEVDNKSTIAQEEIFGPVLSVIKLRR